MVKKARNKGIFNLGEKKKKKENNNVWYYC